jgi:O-antigen ligase
MKLARALSETEAKKVQSFILFGGVFTTLAIWTKLEDPINLPKMFVLVLIAAAVLGLTLPAILCARRITSGIQKVGLYLIGIQILGLLISTFATDVKYTAIFGEYHRNNGFLSYLALSIFMGAGILAYSSNFDKRYFVFLSGTGFLVSTYGVLQGLEKDPIGWVALYNPFITTLGNPNFTSGFLGLAAIATFYSLIGVKQIKLRILNFLIILLEIYVLIKSGSIQGFFAFAIGFSIIVITKLWTYSFKAGLCAIALTTFSGVVVVLGIFNVGPLAEKIFQSTLNNRMDYWQAALAMFKDNILFGVGIDRFGEFYRQYAVQIQVSQGQATDNAHSLYLQILATGGLIAFLPLIILLLFISYTGIRILSRSSGEEKIQISGLMGVWIASLALNVVSIDNLGVGVWLWIVGGIILAKSGKREINQAKLLNKKTTKSDSNLTVSSASNLASLLLSICLLAVMVPIMGKSESLFSLKNNGKGLDDLKFKEAVISENNSSGADTQRRIQILNVALIRGYSKEALIISDDILSRDPRSYYGNLFAAFALEREGSIKQAIKCRESLLTIDPWNTTNMLQLIRNYSSIGNNAAAKDIAALIKRNFPGSPADSEAISLTVG